MRTAAGILMIIGAILGFTLVRAAYARPSAWMIPYEGVVKWLSTFWTIFVGGGGIYILERKTSGY